MGDDEDLKRGVWMSEREPKKTIKEISPIDVYKLLPKTNCGECGEANCMAFATRVVNGELAVDNCPPVTKEEYRLNFGKLEDLMAPPVRTILVGTGDRAMKLGGKYVLYRHEFTYHNPTPIAIDISDDLAENERTARIQAISDFSYNYIGRELRLDAVAIRSTQHDPAAFASAVTAVAAQTDLPLILCTYDAVTMAAGLVHIRERRPLLYAATKDNWKEMAELALRYGCPLVVSAPHDIALLRSLVRTLVGYGVADLGTRPGDSSRARPFRDYPRILADPPGGLCRSR